MDEPIASPAIPSLDPLGAAESSMLTALHAMAHAAGLAMMAGPQTQANARHLAIARLTRTMMALVESNSPVEREGQA